MATIGTFTRTDDAYSGAIKTLSLNVRRRAARSALEPHHDQFGPQSPWPSGAHHRV